MNQLVSGLAPMHPGELLREDILPALNKPKAEIARLIARQEAIGLRAPTDGECRRRVWSIDFFEPLIGVEHYSVERGARFKGAAPSRQIGRAHV